MSAEVIAAAYAQLLGGVGTASTAARGAAPATMPPAATGGSGPPASATQATPAATSDGAGGAASAGRTGGAAPTGAAPQTTSRRPVYSETCWQCGTHVPQHATAALCDHPGCIRLKCVGCHPDLDEFLACDEHHDRVVRLRTGHGPDQVIAAAVAPVAVPADAPAAALPWFRAVATILASAPPEAARGMERAHRLFGDWVRWLGVPWERVDQWVVCSFLLARCAPVAGEALPPGFSKPVSPRTAAGDLTLLRRRARIMGDRDLLDVLTHENVLRLSSMLSAGVSRRKTAKRPILLHHVRSVLDKLGPNPTKGALRDACLLLVGLLAGLRRREITALQCGDLRWDTDRRELTVCVTRDKVNQNILGAQQPRTVVVAHDLLDTWWPRFLAVFGGREANLPAFPRVLGTTVTRSSLAPATINSIVRGCLPGLPVSPHGLRVGMATELFAAGADQATIMEMGRWSSLAALLYVLPSADKLAAASRAIGQGVGVDRAVLQRDLGTSAAPCRSMRRVA